VFWELLPSTFAGIFSIYILIEYFVVFSLKVDFNLKFNFIESKKTSKIRKDVSNQGEPK